VTLPTKILIGLAGGAVFGLALNVAGSPEVIAACLAALRPAGSLFIRLITMIAAPLVLASLIVGASSISDPAKLGRIGAKTLALYLMTTAAAISIGLALAVAFEPGGGVPPEVSERLLSRYQEQAAGRIEAAGAPSITELIVELVPSNPFQAMATGNMLQVVVFALIVGVALSLIPAEKAQPVVRFFDGLTDTLIQIVSMVMWTAPLGVFALIAVVTAEFGLSVMGALGAYVAVVLFGLALHMAAVYGPMVQWLTPKGMSAWRFFRAMAPVHLLAFSSSSSAATLPLNMRTVQDKLGVSERVTSFVLPLGATVNMDGTALYQGVAAAFIAQVYGLPLSFEDHLTIVLTATLASIGTAAVPGAGIIMLVIVLETVGVPTEGVALIFGVDRFLDMCRTVVNITGDAAVAVTVAASEGELAIPEVGFGE
jgi:Na+/H+-dicarboxylate symporter